MKRAIVLIIVCIIIFGCGSKKRNVTGTPTATKDIKALLQESIPKVTDSTKIKRFVMVVAPRAFRFEEFVIPYELLTKFGHKVNVASIDTIFASGVYDQELLTKMLHNIKFNFYDTARVYSASLKPQLMVKDIDTLKFDGIILVGGMGAAIYWDDANIRKFVQYFARTPNKIVAAICLAPVTLARAGVLAGKKATVFEDRETIKELKNNGAVYEKTDVVISGNIITASGPAASEKFARAIALTVR